MNRDGTIWVYLVLIAFWVLKGIFEAKKKDRLRRERTPAPATPQAPEQTEAEAHQASLPNIEQSKRSAPPHLGGESDEDLSEHVFEESYHQEVPSEHRQTEGLLPERMHVPIKIPEEDEATSPENTDESTLIPRDLRKAIILTEIMAKPVSMRRHQRT